MLNNNDFGLLINKVTFKVEIWSSINIPYAERVALINSVPLGAIVCWSKAFL